MNVLVIGGGGREHALIRAIRKSPLVGQIYCLPGNGGIARDAACAPVAATDIEGITAFAVQHAVDFAVVAPDDPLVMGAADALRAAGIKTFGPSRAAARIEGSKRFAKELMKKYGIPTAAYEVFSDAESALAYLKSCAYPVVVKADGLALGKGVRIAETCEQAQNAINDFMIGRVFGESGATVVIEEYLTGVEVSVLAFTDGVALKPMISSMDHKRALDGDRGANTGGMGAVAPNPFYTAEIARRCERDIFLPTLAALRAEGCPFAGCLYFGLMLSNDRPKVIEYNCRFGDPEAQVVLPLLKTDLTSILLAVADGTLSQIDIQWSRGASCCVMVVSGGYPERYEKGKAITLGNAERLPDVELYHSGTAIKDGALVTNGGRVIGVTATAPSLKEAVRRAYAAADEIRFDGAYRRGDIGARALSYTQGE